MAMPQSGEFLAKREVECARLFQNSSDQCQQKKENLAISLGSLK
jgi:hypothetical protein